MTLRDTLKRLFTRNVILTHIPGGRLKAFDVNKAQSIGSPTEYSNKPKWRSGRMFNNIPGYGGGYSNEEIEAQRRQMYIDYELMDTDAIIHSALDLYAEECITKDIHTNDILLIKSGDPKIKKVLYNLFYDIMNLEFNAFSWIRSMCKYGDMFLHLQIAEKYGIVNVMPIHPSLMRREEGMQEDPNETVFYYEAETGFYRTDHNKFPEYEIAHFRLLTDTNILPYGLSILEGARRDFRSMTLAEDAMLLHRIMRAPERRIFYIDIGNIAPEEVDAYIEAIVSETKKTPYIDQETGQVNLRYNLMNMLEDVYLPVRGGQSNTKIETLPGLGNEGQMEDVEYLRKKVLAALKVPPVYFGYEQAGDTKSNLSSIDLRFGRSVERIQKIFVSELYKLALIHLRSQGFDGEQLMDFELQLTSPSLIFERQKIDILTSKIELVKSIKEDNIFSDKYIYENIFGMSEDDWKNELDRIAASAKFKFRITQIIEEGNDPMISGKSFGTPHDIATMQIASKFVPGENQESLKSLYTPDERENNTGKPNEFAGSFETKRDQDFGRDPLGRKEAMEARLSRWFKKDIVKSPLNESEHIDMLDENVLLDDSE